MIRKLVIHRVKTGEIFEDDANVLVAARGTLNNIAWPQIPGLRSFKGEVMHSAAWSEKYFIRLVSLYVPLTLRRYDFKNKKVGVIGGGSSSIQIVPSLQKLEGIKLSCFVRSKTWISNPFGDHSMQKLGLDPEVFECKFSTVFTLRVSDSRHQSPLNKDESSRPIRKHISSSAR
jgi:hypothetical protein